MCGDLSLYSNAECMIKWNCTNVFIRDELSSTTEERKGVKERDDQ